MVQLNLEIVVNLPAFGQPFSVLIQRAQRQKNVRVRIARFFVLVVDGEVAAHAFVHKIPLAVFAYHFRVLFLWHFDGQRHDHSAGKLGVPLRFRFLHAVP